MQKETRVEESDYSLVVKENECELYFNVWSDFR